MQCAELLSVFDACACEHKITAMSTLTYVFRFSVRPLLRTISDFGLTSGRCLTSTISYSISWTFLFYFIYSFHNKRMPNRKRTHSRSKPSMCKLLIEKRRNREEKKNRTREKINCLHWRKRRNSHRLNLFELFARRVSRRKCNLCLLHQNLPNGIPKSRRRI